MLPSSIFALPHCRNHRLRITVGRPDRKRNRWLRSCPAGEGRRGRWEASAAPPTLAPVMSRKALVRRPSPRMAEGLVTHIERTPVDPELAMRQWQGYVDALTGAGWQVTEAEPEPSCPDSAFIEDAVVVYADLAVVTRPGADQRRPETVAAEKAVREVGYRVAHIEAPGTLDGGDVLKV